MEQDIDEPVSKIDDRFLRPFKTCKSALKDRSETEEDRLVFHAKSTQFICSDFLGNKRDRSESITFLKPPLIADKSVLLLEIPVCRSPRKSEKMVKRDYEKLMFLREFQRASECFFIILMMFS